MISFAGGLPAPETFPVSDLGEIALEVLKEDGAAALQYSTTEGDPLLREMIAERHRKQGLNTEVSNIIITTGSQQALDLIGKIFIDPDDHILCGLPSYLGALNAFQTYGARLKGIPLDNDGMIPSKLETAVSLLRDLGRKVKFLYIIPDFQNPAGITLSEKRRMKIIEIASKYNILVIEDSPYREIRFEGKPKKMLYEFDTDGRVLSLCTFSKIFAPGFRVGWIIGNPVLLDRIVIAKQTADLCSSAFVQKILAKYMQKGLLEKNLPATISLYRKRRDHMIECFRKYMPEQVKWTEPHGGLFLFVTLPEGLDAGRILKTAIEHNVAFVDGATFFCNDSGHNTMRINFSYSTNSEIEIGVQRLAEVIVSELRLK
jgi:2-aminoadipate transaminase